MCSVGLGFQINYANSGEIAFVSSEMMGFVDPALAKKRFKGFYCTELEDTFRQYFCW